MHGCECREVVIDAEIECRVQIPTEAVAFAFAPIFLERQEFIYTPLLIKGRPGTRHG